MVTLETLKLQTTVVYQFNRVSKPQTTMNRTEILDKAVYLTILPGGGMITFPLVGFQPFFQRMFNVVLSGFKTFLIFRVIKEMLGLFELAFQLRYSNGTRI